MVEFIKLGITLLIISVVINMGLVAVNVSGTVPGGFFAGNDFNSTSGVFAGLTHNVIQGQIDAAKPKDETGTPCTNIFTCTVQTISGALSSALAIGSDFIRPIGVFVTLLTSALSGFFDLAIWIANPLEESPTGPIHLLLYLIATPLQLLVYISLVYYLKEIAVLLIQVFRGA